MQDFVEILIILHYSAGCKGHRVLLWINYVQQNKILWLQLIPGSDLHIFAIFMHKRSLRKMMGWWLIDYLGWQWKFDCNSIDNFTDAKMWLQVKVMSMLRMFDLCASASISPFMCWSHYSIGLQIRSQIAATLHMMRRKFKKLSAIHCDDHHLRV